MLYSNVHCLYRELIFPKEKEIKDFPTKKAISMLYRRRHSKYTATGKQHSFHGWWCYKNITCTQWWLFFIHMWSSHWYRTSWKQICHFSTTHPLAVIIMTLSNLKQFKAIAGYHLTNISHIYQGKIEKFGDEIEWILQKKTVSLTVQYAGRDTA